VASRHRQVGLGERLTGTLYSHPRGHVHLAFQTRPRARRGCSGARRAHSSAAAGSWQEQEPWRHVWGRWLLPAVEQRRQLVAPPRGRAAAAACGPSPAVEQWRGLVAPTPRSSGGSTRDPLACGRAAAAALEAPSPADRQRMRPRPPPSRISGGDARISSPQPSEGGGRYSNDTTSPRWRSGPGAPARHEREGEGGKRGQICDMWGLTCGSHFQISKTACN
jgi:hypothetical protein